jgi:hypothetical protein
VIRKYSRSIKLCVDLSIPEVAEVETEEDEILSSSLLVQSTGKEPDCGIIDDGTTTIKGGIYEEQHSSLLFERAKTTLLLPPPCFLPTTQPSVFFGSPRPDLWYQNLVSFFHEFYRPTDRYFYKTIFFRVCMFFLFRSAACVLRPLK